VSNGFVDPDPERPNIPTKKEKNKEILFFKERAFFLGSWRFYLELENPSRRPKILKMFN
jgi:hypothetical protein